MRSKYILIYAACPRCCQPMRLDGIVMKVGGVHDLWLCESCLKEIRGNFSAEIQPVVAEKQHGA